MNFLQRNRTVLGAILLTVMLASKLADLHSLFHINDAGKAQHCELCVISQKQHQNHEFLVPTIQEFEPQEVLVSADVFQSTIVEQEYTKLPQGQYFNKPPPVI